MPNNPIFPSSREVFKLARLATDAARPLERVSDAEIGRIVGLESARTSRWKHGQISVTDAARLVALAESTGIDVSVLAQVAAGYMSADEALAVLSSEKGFLRFLSEQILLPGDGQSLSMTASDGSEARVARHERERYERLFRRAASAKPEVGGSDDEVVVLLADDDPGTIEMFGNLTGKGTGIAGVVARTLPEALITAGQTRPRLVVLDLFLGQADGFAALRCLRSHEATSGALLVATSRAAGPDVVRAAKGNGASEVLERPVRARPLGKLLRDLRRR